MTGRATIGWRKRGCSGGMAEFDGNRATATPRGDATGAFDPRHLRRWWETTRSYLFADPDGAATASARRRRRANQMTAHVAQCEARQAPIIAPNEPRAFTELARWAHRQALHLLREAAWPHDDPLRALQRAFHLQVAFVARHPAVPALLLDALAQPSDVPARRRIDNAIGHYEARLVRWIERARGRGRVAATVDARAAARLLVALLQGLLMQMRLGRHAPEQLRGQAARLLPILLNGLRDQGVRLE